MASPLNDPVAWVHRLSQRLMYRQEKYQINEDYAIGDHPLPSGDPRFTRALKEIQHKARTNYVGLANKAVTDRMTIKGFRFGDAKELDPDARRIWNANNMSVQSAVAIRNSAKLSDVYAMVSPPQEEGGEPIITIEDPRVCIVEPDPLNPLKSIAGLKYYEDSVAGTIVAVLIRPDQIYVYDGPTSQDFLTREDKFSPAALLDTGSAWRLRETSPNPLGQVNLIRGPWQPEYGIPGMAECEDGGYDIQDRINTTILLRMVIARSQAFRQRWMTGAEPPPAKGKQQVRAPFNAAEDVVWALADPQARFGDFEQADIRQLLEAARDDIGDFAAVTQTPVMYLTNKLVNVSADTMTAAQVSLVSKAKNRMAAMGWFFENIMKMCFAYKGDPRAREVDAETVWYDPEARSMSEISDMVSKMNAAMVPAQISLEWGGFSEEQIKFAVAEMEKQRQEQFNQQQQLKDTGNNNSTPPGERAKAK